MMSSTVVEIAVTAERVHVSSRDEAVDGAWCSGCVSVDPWPRHDSRAARETSAGAGEDTMDDLVDAKGETELLADFSCAEMGALFFEGARAHDSVIRYDT